MPRAKRETKEPRARKAAPLRLDIHPLTAARWADFETLFGARGACGGCWCMWWRLARAHWNRGKGEGNKRALRRIVAAAARPAAAPGLIAYAAGEPVGWCAVAPRAMYPVLERSRTLARLDDEPVWSVTCLFVARPWRRRGVTVALLRAAADHARRCGARIVEGYPVEPRSGAMPDAFAWTGLVSAFLRAGFAEVARRSATRPIVRRTVSARRGATGGRSRT
jgi:GNAT superfamily N-acetyltransferase